MSLFGRLANISIHVILCIFSHSTYFLNVITITCIYKACVLTVYLLFIICALLLSCTCKLYCTAFFVLVSCLIYLLCHSLFCDVLILTCFMFSCQLTDVGFVKCVFTYVCIT